jgi:glutathione S-transferase
MADLTLYTVTVPSRSAIARWMLEEVGEPYEVRVLDHAAGEHHQPAYLEINPMGKVPAIRHGETVVAEAAAICLYLAETFPQAGLNVPVGDPRRGAFLKWLFFGPSCIEPAVLDVAFPRKETAPRGSVGYGDFETVMKVVEDGLKLGPFILGDKFTAADIIIGSLLRWGMMSGMVPKRENFLSYASRLEERPALQRQMQLDAMLKKPA